MVILSQQKFWVLKKYNSLPWKETKILWSSHLLIKECSNIPICLDRIRSASFPICRKCLIDSLGKSCAYLMVQWWVQTKDLLQSKKPSTSVIGLSQFPFSCGALNSAKHANSTRLTRDPRVYLITIAVTVTLPLNVSINLANGKVPLERTSLQVKKRPLMLSCNYSLMMVLKAEVIAKISWVPNSESRAISQALTQRTKSWLHKTLLAVSQSFERTQ